MYELVKYKKEVELDSQIDEIKSISLECSYNCVNNEINGNFIVEGSYSNKLIIDSEEEFKKLVEFKYTFNKEIEDDSALIEVKDFTYEVRDEKLILDIEYEVSANEVVKTFENESDFERFIEENDVDIVDDKNLISIDDFLENDEVEINNDEDKVEDVDRDKIISYIDTDNDFITYHIYIVKENDTFESIASTYNIDVNTLKEINDVNELFYGMKLIIPNDL